MGRKRPTYTAEFKAEAARLHREGGMAMKATVIEALQFIEEQEGDTEAYGIYMPRNW